MTNVMTALVTAVVMAFLATVVFVFFADKPNIDIMSYTLQRVERIGNDGNVQIPQVDGYDRPSVLIGDRVPARGERIISEDVTEPFRVRANVWWERLDQPGERIQTLTDFVTVIDDLGKVPLRFENKMPDRVVARVLSGDTRVETWRIVGEVQPLLDNVNSASFETEPFLIVTSLEQLIEDSPDGLDD